MGISVYFLLIALGMLCLKLVGPSAAVDCPTDWIPIDTTCYFVTNDKTYKSLTWAEARGKCFDMAADLAMIHNKLAFDEIYGILNSGSLYNPWLRCKSEANNALVYTCDGDDAFYNSDKSSGFWHWDQNYPSQMASQQCLVMNTVQVAESVVMTSAGCDTQLSPTVLCERSPVHTDILTTPVLATRKESKVCYVSMEPDPQSDHRRRWFVSQLDPCACTETRVGGINTHPTVRPFTVKFLDTVLISKSQNEISIWLAC